MQLKSRSLIFATLFLSTLFGSATFAQTRSTWSAAGDIRNGARGTAIGTVIALDEARGRFSLELDTSRRDSQVFVDSDSLTTRYLGFEGAGAIFTGTSGFAKLRLGDRVEIRGVGTGSRAIDADEIILLGRAVSGSPTASAVRDTVEGTVRSVRAAESTFVLETNRREIYEVRGRTSTPVYFEGRTYTIENLEPGDRVRVNVESRNELDGITARSIEVTRDVSPEDDDNSLSSVEGTISRIDTRLSTFRVTTPRGEVRVDARNAVDGSNRRIRLSDFRNGDRVVVTGRYDPAGTLFIADAVRYDRDGGFDDLEDDDRDDPRDFADEYDSVTIEGTVDRGWSQGWFTVRDTSRTVHTVFADRDFVVRTTSGTAISTRIRRGDRITVRAFRDREDRYIAQTIRIR